MMLLVGDYKLEPVVCKHSEDCNCVHCHEVHKHIAQELYKVCSFCKEEKEYWTKESLRSGLCQFHYDKDCSLCGLLERIK